MTVRLDHIVVSARDRDAGAAHVAQTTGAAMAPGGEHAALGTHNHLCRLGGNVFLESISRNPTAPKPDRALWYGLDTPPDPPALSAWVLASDDLDATLSTAASLGHDLGRALPVTRGALSWRFALRDDGGAAAGGAAPYVMQWDQPDPHPSTGMFDSGLELVQLTIATPMADALLHLLDALEFKDERVVVAPATNLRFSASLRTADGATKTLT